MAKTVTVRMALLAQRCVDGDLGAFFELWDLAMDRPLDPDEDLAAAAKELAAEMETLIHKDDKPKSVSGEDAVLAAIESSTVLINRIAEDLRKKRK